MGETDFYTALADHYDELFGCSEGLIDFLVGEGAHPGSRVLDVACGTGACTRALLSRGVDCYATDLSARMIERARALAHVAGIDTNRFSIADMLDAHDHSGVPFDLVVCIGNSISHLPSKADVIRFVRSARSALGPTRRAPGPGRTDATLALQFLDVAALPVGGDLGLPVLHAETATMYRTYRRVSHDRLVFEARLELGDESPAEIAQDLLVLTTDEVAAALSSAGFDRIQVYGGFDRSPVGPDERLRVVVAHA